MPTSASSWIVFHTAPWLLKKLWLLIDYFDSQAFTPALADQHRFQFAALYTLQHGLPRNAQFRCGFDHRHVLWWRLLHDARPQFIIDANLPRRAWRDLLAGDESIGQPAVNDDVFMPRICAALRMETSSPLGGVAGGWNRGIPRYRRKLPTWLAVKRSPVAVFRP